MKPQLVMMDPKGWHNEQDHTLTRMKQSRAYEDLSTIIVCPTRGQIPAKVVQSWMNLMKPMNQKVIGPIFAIGLEVGDAYNQLFELILSNSDLCNWKYVLTIEDDNMPPPDGLLKLYENIEHYDVLGALYWTKGEGGMPMIYGNPKEIPLSFRPQLPVLNAIQPACGLGMGFNLWRLSIFKDDKIPKPWFKTEQKYEPGVGSKVYTQDLYFYEQAGRLGYRFACDTRVRVGHYDLLQDRVW